MAEEYSRALNHAYKLLSYRQRSESELAEKLRRKGFGAGAVEKTIGRLREAGYLDDGELAFSLRRRAEEEKFLGAAGARRYLRRMGIPQEEAEEALRGYDEDEVARKLVRKKLGSMRGLPRAVARRRLAGHMKRRGYSSRTVVKSLKDDKVEALS